MTLFGEKSRFAIEYTPIDDGNIQSPQCHFTYWIDNQQIGNLAFEASLDDLIEEIRSILVHRGQRRNSQLFYLPAEEVVRIITNGLSGKLPETEGWASYSVTYSMGHGYPLEEGLRYDIYAIEDGDLARIIVSNSDDNALILETNIHAGELDRIFMSAWDLMSELR